MENRENYTIEELEREIVEKLADHRDNFHEAHLRRSLFNYISDGNPQSAQVILTELKKEGYSLDGDDALIYLATASSARKLNNNNFAKLMYGITAEHAPELREDLSKLSEMLATKETGTT